MKKISCFLAAVMLFIAMASPFEPASTVHAFAESEIDDSNFHWSNEFPIEIDQDFSGNTVEGYTLALCMDVENPTLADVKYEVPLSDKDNLIGGAGENNSNKLKVKWNMPDDFVDGFYKLMLFDENRSYWLNYSSCFYSSRTPLTPFSCDVMNNDGYAYAYAYDPYGRNPLKNADHFPELYDINKNKVAHFESFSKEVVDGDNVYIYKLKIDNQDAFQMDSTGNTTLYYRLNKKNGSATERSDKYTANWADSEGFGTLTVFDFNIYMDKINQSKGNDSKPNKEKTTYRTPVSNAIKQVVAAGGTAEINGITALSYDEMKEISKNPDAKLVMHFTYNDVKYKVIVTGKDAVLDPTIPWYGPLYLAGKYGNALATAE